MGESTDLINFVCTYTQSTNTKVGRIMLRCYLFKIITKSHTIYAAKGMD